MKYMKYIKLGSALLITGVFAIFYFPFKCTLLGFRWITDIMEDFDNQITIWIKKIKQVVTYYPTVSEIHINAQPIKGALIFI